MAEKTEETKKPKDPVASAAMWGAIAGGVSSVVGSGVQLTGMLNGKVRENNLAIAEANARAAEATAAASGSGSQLFGVDRKYIFIGVALLLLLILALVFTKKPA